MSADTPTGYTDADIVQVADVVRDYLDAESPEVSRLLFNQEVEEIAMRVLAALAGAGRLLPEDTRTDEDFAVRFKPTDSIIVFSDDADHGREWIRAVADDTEHGQNYEVVRRETMSWVGPWVPVPANERPDASEVGPGAEIEPPGWAPVPEPEAVEVCHDCGMGYSCAKHDKENT